MSRHRSPQRLRCRACGRGYLADHRGFLSGNVVWWLGGPCGHEYGDGTVCNGRLVTPATYREITRKAVAA